MSRCLIRGVRVTDRQALTAVHTLQYLRSASTVLFSAVLFASSKFFRRDLHPTLETHFYTHLNRLVNSASCHLGLIQALMIAVFWKAPTDVTTWAKLGLAIRFGYQMRLHQPRKVPLPNDEGQARLVVNAERTWFCE